MKNQTRGIALLMSVLLIPSSVIAGSARASTARSLGKVAQAAEQRTDSGADVRVLEPGKAIEQEMAGGQKHTYQITLQAGQFLRAVVEQKGIDVALALVTPSGKEVAAVNFTRAGGLESLSYEAAVGGGYQFAVRAVSAAPITGAYQVRLEVGAAATAQNKQRIAAEQLLAEALNSQGQQIVEKLQQALALWRELGDRYWEAYTLYQIGASYRVMNQYNKATECLEQALAIRREVKDRYGEGQTLNYLGIVYRLLSRHDKAAEYHEQSLVIEREVKDKVGEGYALNNLGITYFSLGRYDKAIEYYEQSLAVSREVKDRYGEGQALQNLGTVYRSVSRYDKAIACLEQALTIRREVKDRRGEGQTLNNLGATYYSLGRYDKAIEYYEQALTVSRDLKDQYDEALQLNNLGEIYSLLGRYEKAVEILNQALAVGREIKDRPIGGDTLKNLGIIYYHLGQYDKAVDYLEQALAVGREIKDREGEEGALDNLGVVYRSLSRFDQAIGHHGQALRIAREIKDRSGEGAVLSNLMLDWKARDQSRLAIFFGKQSVNLYQEIRSDLRTLERESQQSFLKAKEETYRNLADLLIAQGRLPEAEQVINLLKEEEYFEFIRRDSSASGPAGRSDLTPEEAVLEKRYREIADQLTALGAERGALIDKKSRTPEEEQRLAKLDADLTVAGQFFQNFLSQLASELGNSAEAANTVYHLRESQSLMETLRALGAGTVALYTLVGEEKYRVILMTSDVQKGYEYSIKAADLNRKVLAFREALQDPKLDPLPLAQELYRVLLGPLTKDLKGAKAQTLMWSLDGALRYLPMAALHDGEKYLIERYRQIVFTPASRNNLKDVPNDHWKALGLGVTKAHGDHIPALPGVREEMRGIIYEEGTSAKGGILPGTIKLDEAFTEVTMLAGLRQRLPVVHIASHFQFQPGNETNSALLLGDGSFLNLERIKSLPNVFGGVDLLTLSACNTATGGSGANGKEVEGFGVLAQRQGAKAVVASLWPVVDRSTAVLMQEFYRLHESQAGTTKVEALRQAQLKLLRGEQSATGGKSGRDQSPLKEEKPGAANKPLNQKASAPDPEEKDRRIGLKPAAGVNQPRFVPNPKSPYAHPYYWAPFILIGNWK